MKSLIRKPHYQGLVSLLAVIICSIFNNSCNSASPSNVSPSPKPTGFVTSIRTPSFTPTSFLSPTPTPSPTSTPVTYNWETHGPWGGPVSALAIDPKNSSNLYANAFTGFYKSKDGGDSWTESNAGLEEDNGIHVLAIDPGTTSTIYAGTPGGVYKSTDSGENWSLSSGTSMELISDIAIHPFSPSKIYASTVFEGVYRSMDGGERWYPINNGLPIKIYRADGYFTYSLVMDPLSPDNLYVGTAYSGVFKTSDGGDEWVSCNAGLPADADVKALTIDPITPSTLYVGIYDKGLYKSYDNGNHWFPINNGLPISYPVRDIAIDPSAPNTVYAATYNGIYRSMDGGKIWRLFSSIENVDEIIIDPSASSVFYAIKRSGIYKSINQGKEWYSSSEGISSNDVKSFAVDPSDPNTVYAGTYQSGLFRSTNNGKSWDSIEAVFSDDDISKIIVDPRNSDIIYIALGGWGVYKSLDKGVTWKPVNTGLESKIGVVDMAIDPMNPETLYLVQFQDGVYKTTNGGLFWNKLTSGFPGLSDCEVPGLTQIAIDPGNPSSVYALSVRCGLYKSADNGGHWDRIFYQENASIETLFIDPSTSSIYIVVSKSPNGDMIYKSDDGGVSWFISHSNLPFISYYSDVLLTDPEMPTTLYLGLDDSIFKSENSGEWIYMGKISKIVETLSITLSTPPVLHAGTDSGVYSLPLVR
jgi:photosystem II stability/assembly factor-like uncharacterized protein